MAYLWEGASELMNLKNIIILFLLTSSTLFYCNTASGRRVKTDHPNTIFIEEYEYLTDTEIATLNKELAAFVSEITAEAEIVSISKPRRETARIGPKNTYSFQVTTDKETTTIYVKFGVNDFQGTNFEKAKEAGITPAGEYIPSLDVIVTKHFEGIELFELIHSPEELIENGNYRWVFSQLGEKVALMELHQIIYKDYFHYSTLIDLENQEIVIIDYEDILLNISPPVNQVRDYIDSLEVPDETREEIEVIFEESYQLALSNVINP